MPGALNETKCNWLEMLETVEPFVEARPPEEIGCLYYSVSRQKFVDPREVTDATPHFGRPGGVLPRINGSSGAR